MVNRNKYPRQVRLNLTEKQYQQLFEKSKKNGVSYSEFLRNQILFAPQNTESVLGVLKKILYELHKQGVNVNQISHAANMDLFSSKEKNEFFAYMEKYNKDKKELMDFIFEVVTILGGK